MDLPPEQEPDCCDDHGALEDVDTLVEPRDNGPEVLEGVDRAVDFTSVLVDRFLEAGGPFAPVAAALAVGPLVLRLGDGVLALPSAQLAAVRRGGISLVAAEVVRPGAGASAAMPATTASASPASVPPRWDHPARCRSSLFDPSSARVSPPCRPHVRARTGSGGWGNRAHSRVRTGPRSDPRGLCPHDPVRGHPAAHIPGISADRLGPHGRFHRVRPRPGRREPRLDDGGGDRGLHRDVRTAWRSTGTGPPNPSRSWHRA